MSRTKAEAAKLRALEEDFRQTGRDFRGMATFLLQCPEEECRADPEWAQDPPDPWLRDGGPDYTPSVFGDGPDFRWRRGWRTIVYLCQSRYAKWEWLEGYQIFRHLAERGGLIVAGLLKPWPKACAEMRLERWLIEVHRRDDPAGYAEGRRQMSLEDAFQASALTCAVLAADMEAYGVPVFDEDVAATVKAIDKRLAGTMASAAPGDEAEDKADFEFRRSDRQHWRVRFEGKGAMLDHQKGLTYIHELLRRQGQGPTTAEALEKAEGYIVAESIGAVASADELEGDEVGAGAGGDEGKKVYNRVTKAIRRAKEAIRKEELLQPLWAHLDTHLRVGNFYYAPDKPIDWTLT